MTKIFGIEFAPLYIPMHRRLQTLAVAHYIFAFIVLPIMLPFLLVYLYFDTPYWWVLLLYGMWMFYDRKTQKRGSRTWLWMRRWGLWKYLRDFFPVTLEKTVDLDPKRNYLFGCHPHGILCCGMFTNFATEATGFSEKFPGFKSHPITLACQFYWPFRREYVLLMGLVDSSKESLEYLFQRKKGHIGVLVVGGARESLDANPGKYDLELKKRKGFIKIALTHGVSLVPVFSFGENELYVQIDSPFFRKIQTGLKYMLSFPLPLFTGRGFFNYSIGWLPKRKPITSVVGKPIHVDKKTPTPTQEQIEEFHTKYLDGLIDLFETNKARFGIDEKTHLNIL